MEKKDLLLVLEDKGLTLSSMESLTGGLFASTFTSIPGASHVYQGSAITYQDSIKEAFHVKKETIDAYGAISMECAKEMALQASLFFKSDVAVSFTGNAGPESQEGKDVGLVYVGIRLRNTLYGYKLKLHGSRDEIRKQCVDFAFSKLYALVSSL